MFLVEFSSQLEAEAELDRTGLNLAVLVFSCADGQEGD